jgi:SAM-dependent methyltransferase
MKWIKIIKSPKYYSKALLNRLKNVYRTTFYKGEQVYCGICNWKGRRFFNGKCPKCSSVPRTRLVPFSFQYFDLLKDKINLLHLAPNKTEYDFIRSHIDTGSTYDRMDILPYKHVNLLKDITNSDLTTGSYDIVVAWHLFEHIPDDIQAISEVYRILVEGGKALVSVPIYPKDNKVTYEDSNIEYSDYEKVHGHYDHCRSCGLDYFERFEDQGFMTETLYVNVLPETTVTHFGLRPDHVVWCFTK